VSTRGFVHRGRQYRATCWSFALFTLASIAIPGSSEAAPLTGTVLTPLNSIVSPGVVPNGTAAGVLLASLSFPFMFSTTGGGTTQGTITSAVFREVGGTLDFYYQITNNAASSTDISRDGQLLTAGTNPGGVSTWTGFRTDAAGPLVAGTVAPSSADRLLQTVPEFGLQFGLIQVVGFTLDVAPGSTSNALVISTDATTFASGTAVLYGSSSGSGLAATFQPVTNLPEPCSIFLTAAGILGLWGRRAFKRYSGSAVTG
jgi:hypothetical protein